MTDDSHVIERVMRMGIEHRNGVPVSDLYNLATRQLIAERKAERSIPAKFSNLEDWWAYMCTVWNVPYAFAVVNGRLEVVKLTALTQVQEVLRWRSPTLPEVVLRKVNHDGR